MAAFQSQECAARFQQFGHWLVTEIGVRKAALTIHRYLNFFLAFEAAETLESTLAILLQEKRLANLRPQNLPLRFLTAIGIALSDETKKAIAEKKHIRAILDEVANPPYRILLHTYYGVLQSKHSRGITSLLSIRLALRAAVSLIRVAIAANHRTIKQTDVTHFLKSTPGQRAALYGFVTFVRRSQHVDLSVPHASTHNTKFQREKIEKEFIAAITAPVILPFLTVVKNRG